MRLAAKLTVFLLLPAIIVVFPFIVGDSETETLDEDARAAMREESFIALDGGVTHYELAGPEDGPVVVFVHGLTSPYFIWDNQFKEVADAGFRVLRYDSFGRGLSDRPKVNYDADLFDRQLLNLLDALGIDEPVTLVGLSMGGVTTIHFTDRHPQRVRAFVLFAPGGMREHLPVGARIITMPGIRNWMAKAFGDLFFERMVIAEFTKDAAQLEAIRENYARQMQYKGYKRAVLNTLRHNRLYGLKPVFARVGKKGKPAMAIWGDRDTLVPPEHSERLRRAIPAIELHIIEGAGHTANYEFPDKVNPLLLDFLKRHARH